MKFARNSMASATVLAALLTVSACNRSGGAIDSSTGAADTTAGEAGAEGPSADAIKLSGYTQAYNKLIGTFGLTETAHSYEEDEIARKTPSDSISVTDGWVDQGAAAMKKTRALKGGSPELDAAADRLIVALDRVVARVGALKIYYDAKSYKEDGLARGKREDPLMRADFAGALNALHAFDTVLTRERDREDERDMAALKAKGDLLGYQTKVALKKGERLVDLFKSEADIRDPAKIATADGLVAAMEAALVEQRKEYAAAKAKATAGEAPDTDYERVASYLTSLAGDYRELKQNRDVDGVNAMVKEYNNAVEDANDID